LYRPGRVPTPCQNGLTLMSSHFHLIIHDGQRTAHGNQDQVVLKDSFTEMKELPVCTCCGLHGEK
jgi:hypothetical protein